MLLTFLILCGHVFFSQTAIFLCDFETICNDFDIDTNWGLTDGLHPESIDHDHTLNTSAGHYLFYSPKSSPPFYDINAKIKTKDWIEPSIDRAICFHMWYYTPESNLPFSIQLVQGDDEQLTRIVASIPGKDPSIDDWTFINITLPSEKIKIVIRLNTSIVPLAFDDLSVDYCEGPQPIPPKILYECDFESSCTEQFFSLPNYPYEWSIMKADDAITIESAAPSVDFTFNNQSGHYALVPNSKIIAKGNVGYFALQTSFNITTDESYCLNFQYYAYGQPYASHLKVYAWILDSSETIQVLWPPVRSQYIYISNKWTWSIVNLPIGDYSLLFRVDNSNTYASSFAIDNISITSCDYSSSIFQDDGAFLSFSCDFDNLTMCDMENSVRYPYPSYNFTVVTGETVPNRDLGPLQDHTNNSTTGGFIYWDRHLPFTSGDFGNVLSSKSVEINSDMCIKFAYYVKSSIDNKNGTQLGLVTGGCLGTQMWSRSLDDSKGWQVVILPTPNVLCMETFYFQIYQREPVAVSVALDDIEVASCDIISPTTTTTSTTTTTATTTTTTVTTSTTTQTTTTSSSTTTTSTTSSTNTSPRSSSQRLLFSHEYHLIIISILLLITREIL
ncbi:unnamed protein product [Adineta steineri]|uniref:MAM domain-containing protein n=1 Tax=Adineta steineri TaxID=433720 RepID=A0A818TPP7_9BILA|nr:unnamed protein product [Adineta steineri]